MHTRHKCACSCYATSRKCFHSVVFLFCGRCTEWTLAVLIAIRNWQPTIHAHCSRQSRIKRDHLDGLVKCLVCSRKNGKIWEHQIERGPAFPVRVFLEIASVNVCYHGIFIQLQKVAAFELLPHSPTSFRIYFDCHSRIESDELRIAVKDLFRHRVCTRLVYLTTLIQVKLYEIRWQRRRLCPMPIDIHNGTFRATWKTWENGFIGIYSFQVKQSQNPQFSWRTLLPNISGHDERDVAMFRSRSSQTLSHLGAAQRNTLWKYLTGWKSLPFSRLLSMPG